MEFASKIINLITSICFLVGVIWAYFSFKYKHDSDVRALYIKNCEKILEGLRQICRDARVSQETFGLFFTARDEAGIYLHQDIFNFVDELYNKAVKLSCYNRRLESLPVGEKRNEICDKEAEIMDYFSEKLPNVRNFYRKYIINEFSIYDKYFPTFKKWTKNSIKTIDNHLCSDFMK